MAETLADFRWIGPHGIGRFAEEVLTRLHGVNPILTAGRPMDGIDPLRLAWRLRQLRPKLFFSPGYNAPWRSSVPCVFTLHDLIHLDVPEETSLLKQAYYRHFVRPMTRRAARVLTISRYSQMRICQWAGISEDRVSVVGIGISRHFTPEGEKHAPGYPYLLYVGSCKPHKNIPRILQAFSRAKDANDLRLILVCDCPPHLLEEIRRLGIERRIVLAKGLSEEELARYYRGATALIMPSLHEGFGLPAVEAMACGTAAIASNATSVPEAVGDAAILVDPADVDALAHAIGRVARDERLRRELITKGLAQVKQFNWDQTARRIQNILAECV